MRKHFLLLGLALLATSSLWAQQNFRAAYLIKLDGDTLYGEVDSRGDEKMGFQCRFRARKKAAVQLFTPTEIAAFRFINGKYFVAKEVVDGSFFLEFMIKGKINLYYRRDEKGDHYYLQKENEPIEKLEYEEKFVKREGKKYLYQTKKHIRQLHQYTDRLSEFAAGIERMDKPSYRPMLTLAEDYHNTVCPDEACIIYAKDLPFLKLNFELGAGLNNWTLAPEFGLTHYRLGAYIWLPRANENLYLKTGLAYIPKAEQEAISDFMLPIQITYIFPTRFIKPHFSAGFNHFLGSETVPVVAGGLNLSLTKQLELSFRTEVAPISLALGRRSFLAFEAGLYLKL
ncbi:MAG: hypothetical protein AAF927_06085 [Bacteroidota bacterium]